MDVGLMEEYKKLSAKKDEIESSIKALAGILETQGVGMQDALVDKDGYPRSDVDVYSIRQARHSIICLQNDHVDIMKQLEEKLYQIHAVAREQNERLRGNSTATSSSLAEEQTSGAASSAAFLVVDSVAESSPAHAAGLQSGDRIIEFGSVNKANYKGLSDIGQAVLHSKDRPLRIAILREGTMQHLSLTPREWSGKGLLGCHVINLPAR